MNKPFLVLSLVLLLTPDVQAQVIRSISSEQAKGLGTSLVKITTVSNHPTIINFRSTGEKIRQIVLGEFSQIAVSSDDPQCLALPNQAANRGKRSCQATILYIQRNPQVLAKAQKNTRLTVLTDESLYLFEIVYNPKNPDSVVEILPEKPLTDVAILPKADLYYVLLRGYRVANERKLLTPELSRQIERLLSSIKAGQTLEEAATSAGISLEAAEKLEELGAK